MTARRARPLPLALLLVAAAPYSARLDVARCAPLPAAEAASLGPDWADVSAYVGRCRVPGPDGRTGVTVDTFRYDQALAAGFFAGPRALTIPRPLIRDRAGRVIGTLPESFPVEPPGRLRVRFSSWRDGLPREIRLFQAGESALAPHPLPPLRWDAAAARYR